MTSIPPEAPPLAAIDLGSNSFHMIIARVDHGRVQVLDRLREPVRLAAGLGDDGSLDKASRKRAIEALERMGQRIRSFGATEVRAVGTNTLRKAGKAKGFKREAEKALGHSIEVIPGREEARLIYLGVCHGVAEAPARRLVIDIGGGSTECIVGDGFEPVLVHSLYMGCVEFTKRFFDNGKLSKKKFNAAEVAAELELRPILKAVSKLGWQRAYGASGTIKAVAGILEANGWGNGTITAEGINKLRAKLIEAEHVDNVRLPGLDEDRKQVIAGGMPILRALVSDLEIEEMWVSPTALREGLLYEALGREEEEDPRDRTIAMLNARFAIDQPQAQRVARLALGLLSQVNKAWALPMKKSSRLLLWACQLHELGLAVNYAAHHKHAAYLIAESDLPGFSTDDKRFLSSVVRGHRRKFQLEYFDILDETQQTHAIRLSVILRLAVLLMRNRSTEEVPIPKCKVSDDEIQLKFKNTWLQKHPLVQADLQIEERYLASIGYELRWEPQ